MRAVVTGGVWVAVAACLALWASEAAAAEDEDAGEAGWKTMTGSLETGASAARQPTQDLATVSPLLRVGIRPRPEVELQLGFGAAMLFADSQVDGEVRVVRPGNVLLGTRWVRDAAGTGHRGHIGFAFALPTNFRLTDRETEALDYAVAVRGGLDPWLWLPATLGIVVPGGWTWRAPWMQVGADGALAALVAAANNPDRPGFAAQARGHVAFASPWVVLGAYVSGAVNTRDTRNKTQVAVGPFLDVPLCFGKRRRQTCPLTAFGQVNVNLDRPYGFVGDGLHVWGGQVGLRWAMYDSSDSI